MAYVTTNGFDAFNNVLEDVDSSMAAQCITLIQARKRELERLRKQLASATVLDSLGSPGNQIDARPPLVGGYL